jgi:hypothetical protein
MEKALGYHGFRRGVAFKVAEPGLIYWVDGIDDGFAEVSLLDRFPHSPTHRATPQYLSSPKALGR